MLYAYNKDTGTLVPCQPTDFKAQGFMERFDMEKWVETDPTVLGEDLMVITTEYSGFDKTNERLDVLAMDTQGNLVVVELKRDDSGKHVDLQALKYAAYCAPMTLDDIAEIHVEYRGRTGHKMSADAARETIKEFVGDDEFEELSDKPRVMLVAREYRSEVTSSVQWLRSYGIDITCIKWDVFQLPDQSVVVDTSTLIPQPETRDFEMRVQRKEMAERRLSRTMIATNEFYTRCIEGLKQRVQQDLAGPRSQSYYYISTDIPRVHFEWGFHGRPRSSLGVELHFEKSHLAQNRDLLAECEKHIPELEAALGESVTIENPWGQRWVRIYIESDTADMSEELEEWAVDKMEALINVMNPVLARIAST